jgi:hypothetical protein
MTSERAPGAPQLSASARELPDALTPTCAISIRDSKVGALYQRFGELTERAQSTARYMDFIAQHARNRAIVEQLRAAIPIAGSDSCASDPATTARAIANEYARLCESIPGDTQLASMGALEAHSARQKIQETLALCDTIRRYLYHMYIEECLDAEIASAKGALTAVDPSGAPALTLTLPPPLRPVGRGAPSSPLPQPARGGK